MLILIGKQLDDLGYKLDTAGSLKPKHIDALVTHWMKEELSPGSIKNRMSVLRWLSGKIGKQGIVARANDAYGIADRQFVTNEDKGRTLTDGEVNAVMDPYKQMSLRLQAAFGLRREESIKFQPEWADRGDRLILKASWTKGGLLREIPIRTDAQRALIDEAKALAKTTAQSIGNIKGLVIWCNGQHGGHGIGIVAAAQLLVIFPAKFPMGFARNS